MKFVVNESQSDEEHSRRASRSWEVCQNFFYFLAAQRGCVRPRTQRRQSRDRVSHKFDSVRAFLARRQYNSPTLYIDVQRIAGTNIESTPKRPWKDDLSLGRYFGLHGKTILRHHRVNLTRPREQPTARFQPGLDQLYVRINSRAIFFALITSAAGILPLETFSFCSRVRAAIRSSPSRETTPFETRRPIPRLVVTAKG
jgi:hypothetical protein